MVGGLVARKTLDLAESAARPRRAEACKKRTFMVRSEGGVIGDRSEYLCSMPPPAPTCSRPLRSPPVLPAPLPNFELQPSAINAASFLFTLTASCQSCPKSIMTPLERWIERGCVRGVGGGHPPR